MSRHNSAAIVAGPITEAVIAIETLQPSDRSRRISQKLAARQNSIAAAAGVSSSAVSGSSSMHGSVANLSRVRSSIVQRAAAIVAAAAAAARCSNSSWVRALTLSAVLEPVKTLCELHFCSATQRASCELAAAAAAELYTALPCRLCRD
eukprot:8225-Heterococcus_DN1.PRE.1